MSIYYTKIWNESTLYCTCVLRVVKLRNVGWQIAISPTLRVAGDVAVEWSFARAAQFSMAPTVLKFIATREAGTAGAIENWAAVAKRTFACKHFEHSLLL